MTVLRWQLSWAPLALLAAAALSTRAACPPEQLVTYQLDVDTHWSKQRFPKHYPLWRPPAQFSKFFGLSHNRSRLLYREGELAPPAVRQFSETADATELEQLAQGQSGILDLFTAPPVKQGQGTTMTRVFVDGAHSQVSLISKIVPSPDWFIGVDSVNLCDGTRWVDSVHLQLFPMDAGTDQGLTFTSPNWKSEPPEPIYRITARRPSHPAGSFHYQDITALPPLASLRLTRVRSYALSTEFDQRDTVTYTVDTLDPSRVLAAPSHQSNGALPGLRVLLTSANQTVHSKSSQRLGTAAASASPAAPHYSSAKLAQVALPPPQPPEKVTPQVPHPNAIASSPRGKATAAPAQSGWSRRRHPSSLSSDTVLTPGTGHSSSPNPHADATREVLRPDGGVARAALRPDGSVARVALRPDGSVARVALRPDGPPLRLGGLRIWAVSGDQGEETKRPAGDGQVPAPPLEGTKVRAGDRQAILRRIASHYRRRHGRHGHRRRRRRRKRKRVPRDCVVGEWASWGPCSKDCGIGEMTRRRAVRQHAVRGGRPCPSLQQRRWCGSERSCKRKQYFRW